MEAEEILNLFDSCWFGQEILDQESVNPSSTNPDLNFPNNSSESKISTQLSIHTRSMCDQIRSVGSDSVSPSSVLYSPHLKTGSSRSPESGPRTEELFRSKLVKEQRKNKGKTGLSKSLSELEFEELKGFMDLGFVFSEEDVESSLVEIIPGLQRLGKEKNGEEERKSEGGFDKGSISRPYLSEAWDDGMGRRSRREIPLINWRVPSLGDEIDIKDSLKWWAHTVASTVR